MSHPQVHDGPASARWGAAGMVTSVSLLERARADDAGAWRRLVGLYRPLVLFWCGRAGVPADDAEDVAQEVFAAAAAGLGRFHRDRPGDTFRGWLRTITRNQAKMYFRRNRGRVRAEGGSDAWAGLQNVADPLADRDAEEAEVGRLYGRALELVRCEFEERTWRAFWRTAIDDRPTDAVAAELGLTPAGVRQAKSRVLRRLKQEVGDVPA